MFNSRKQHSFEEVLSKLGRYCAYQERSPQEVLLKARQLGLDQARAEEALEAMTKSNFVDEKRFAKAYIRGKSQIKQWGIYRIKEGLYSKGIQGELAEQLLNQISQSQEEEKCQYWVSRKTGSDTLSQDEHAKLYRFLLSKGFSHDVIQKCVKQLKKD